MLLVAELRVMNHYKELEQIADRKQKYILKNIGAVTPDAFTLGNLRGVCDRTFPR